MMKYKKNKLKKYLFLISTIFLLFSLAHLIYIYVYSDSKLVPIKGGTVSEGLVGSFPSLNPLKPLKGNNKYIVDLLYRSLLKYDVKENKITSDLASCDISNLLNVECYLKDNIFWSNGEAITVNDIIATYELLQNTGVNKVTTSILEGTKIEYENNTITFKNTKKDINFLNIFFQPILSVETINSIGTETIFGDFPTHGQIYSGKFKISNISSDLTIGITKFILERNEFNKAGNVSKLIIKLFPNTNSLLQNKESINIFNDNDNIIGTSIPRLNSNKYTLPQYVSLFINKDNVKDLSLRNYILQKINTKNLVKILGSDNFSTVNNPYLTEGNIEKELTNRNFEKIISNLGYIKKSKIISNFLPKKTEIKKYSDEVKIIEKTNTGEIVKSKELKVNETNIEEKLTINKFQKDSKYIVKPAYVDKYNFITKDDILLEGNVGKHVTEIYINNYKLSNFTTGDSKFYYRIKESYNTIKQGRNTYKIYFTENGKKILKEELNFLYYKNKSTLDTEKVKYLKELNGNDNSVSIQETNNVKKEEIKTVETKKTEIVEIDKTKLEKLSNLDEKYYYNDKLEKFTLDLYFISSEKELEETAYFIKNSLYEIGIDVELFPIRLSELSKILSEKEKYDMIITGINLGYFDYNIFPYFHSSQVKNGYNFSNIKKTSLDILLEDLKSEIKTPEENKKIKNKILEILKKEQIVKTLYTPKINLLVDKNIKNINVSSKIINKSYRNIMYDDIYIKEEKILNLKDKGFINFFKFLLEQFNV